MSVLRFSDGIPKRKHPTDGIHYPEEFIGKKCGGCLRCMPGKAQKDGHHCTLQGKDVCIRTDDRACVRYLDAEEEEEFTRKANEDQENRRRELWAIYSTKEPVKLPIVDDGYGMIPECPICGETPYDYKQCYWCGQRFIEDEAIKEYATPKEEPFTCPSCGAEGKSVVSKYNGHHHFKCEACGFSMME